MPIIAHSTPRQRKGHRFEKIIQSTLDNAGISYEGNDISSIHSWKRSQGQGADIKIGDIEVEVKYTHARVYPSYIWRDWHPRFSPDAKKKIVVTNRGMQYSKRTKALIRNLGIILLFYDQLINFLVNILRPTSKKNTQTTRGVTSFLEPSLTKVINIKDFLQSKRLKAEKFACARESVQELILLRLRTSLNHKKIACAIVDNSHGPPLPGVSTHEKSRSRPPPTLAHSYLHLLHHFTFFTSPGARSQVFQNTIS